MLEVVARLILGGILIGAALAKLAAPGSSRLALATFGVRHAQAQWVLWVSLVVAELALGVAVIAGEEAAAFAAAALMALFAATMIGAILRGRGGAPCACFGARSTVSAWGVTRNLVLAAGFAALPFLPEGEKSTDAWLALGLAVALLACAALAVAVLALAREVGMLRLRLGPEGALEIEHEGPAVGSRVPLTERFATEMQTELALAVFTSRGCHVCEALKPSIDSLRRDPLVAVAVFEEERDRQVWSRLQIPGSPFAIALGLDGTVLAKGAFNNLAQLESVLATAERRRDERGLVEALGA